MLPTLFILFTLALTTNCQIQLTSGQTFAGIISPGQTVQFVITVPQNLYSMIIDFGGNANFDDSQTLQITPSTPLRPLISFADTFSSRGIDITSLHTAGSLCPQMVTSGDYFFDVTTRSSTQQDFVLRITLRDPDISTTMTYTGPLCCQGSDREATDYFLFNAIGAQNLTIYGARSSQRETIGDNLKPAFLLRLNDCPSGTASFDYDYRLIMPDDGSFSFTLNENSVPPFQGGLYWIAPISGGFFDSQPGQDSITFTVVVDQDVAVTNTNMVTSGSNRLKWFGVDLPFCG